jgi:hypothetical protein
MTAQRCPYCNEWHPTAAALVACSDSCWETRGKPLPHGLKVDVLQGRMTLAEAERVAQAGAG